MRLKSRWPYHRAGGAPPQAEAMDGRALRRNQLQCATRHRRVGSVAWDSMVYFDTGKEEIRVVEEEPSWTGGSLESLDVIDKVPDESVKLATD